MTTRIKITNEGPESASIWAYKEDRTFHKLGRLLKVGESLEVDVWNGYLPVVMPAGPTNTEEDLNGGPKRFFSVPPAHY